MGGGMKERKCGEEIDREELRAVRPGTVPALNATRSPF